MRLPAWLFRTTSWRVKYTAEGYEWLWQGSSYARLAHDAFSLVVEDRLQQHMAAIVPALICTAIQAPLTLNTRFHTLVVGRFKLGVRLYMRPDLFRRD